jgi:hypothetical protein
MLDSVVDGHVVESWSSRNFLLLDILSMLKIIIIIIIVVTYFLLGNSL